jgi:hypothetical protein
MAVVAAAPAAAAAAVACSGGLVAACWRFTARWGWGMPSRHSAASAYRETPARSCSHEAAAAGVRRGDEHRHEEAWLSVGGASRSCSGGARAVGRWCGDLLWRSHEWGGSHT